MCQCTEKVRYDSPLYYKTAYQQLSGVSTSSIAQHDYVSNEVGEISCATAQTAGFGEIVGLELMETGTTVQKKDLRVWFFDKTITTPVSNSARSFTTGEVGYIIGYIDIVAADYQATDSGTASAYAQVFLDKPIPFQTLSGSQTIYYAVEVWGSSAPTYGNSTPLKFRFLFKRG